MPSPFCASRLPALPQDLPVHAAGLHLWNLVSTLFPGPCSWLPLPPASPSPHPSPPPAPATASRNICPHGVHFTDGKADAQLKVKVCHSGLRLQSPSFLLALILPIPGPAQVPQISASALSSLPQPHHRPWAPAALHQPGASPPPQRRCYGEGGHGEGVTRGDVVSRQVHSL